MANYVKYRNIVVPLSTYEKLRQIGPNDSFNKVICELISKAEHEKEI